MIVHCVTAANVIPPLSPVNIDEVIAVGAVIATEDKDNEEASVESVDDDDNGDFMDAEEEEQRRW